MTVLHALRCGGYSRVARIAAATGLDAAAVESDLIDLGIAGLVTRIEGGVWGLTEAGRAADAERTAAELAATGARPAVAAAYERFMVLNPELLDLCTAWQLRPVDGVTAVNDHDDLAYDTRVLDRFADLDARAAGVCAALTAALPRFGRYPVRLRGALERVASGDLEYLTDSTGSYHAIWAELHEDQLATLGIPR